MISFLIKSTICLGLLWSFYKLILENESIHRFKRFFLLGCIPFAFIIPFIDIETNAGIYTLSNEVLSPIMIQPPISASNQIDYVIPITIIYVLISIFFMGRLILAIKTFYNKKESGNQVRWDDLNIVLVNDDVQPHAFLQDIYLNRKQYEQGNIPRQLLNHEAVHVRQFHSLDILFIEIAIAIFWWNPILRQFKKAIQLNHEFLADQEVIIESDITSYQRLLLTQIKCTKNYLASSIYYITTKKRLEMMMKKTSKVRALFRRISVIPLFYLLLMTFSNTAIAQGKGASTTQMNEYKVLVKSLQDNNGNWMRISKTKAEKALKILNIMSQDQIDQIKEENLYLPPPPPAPPKPIAPPTPPSPSGGNDDGLT